MINTDTLFSRVSYRIAELTPAEFRARLEDAKTHPLVRAMRVNEFESSPLQACTAWGKSVGFGNLIKADGVPSLCWYTVELAMHEVFEFDAEALKELRSSNLPAFGEDASEDVRAAALLAEKVFPTFEAFELWVRTNFQRLD